MSCCGPCVVRRLFHAVEMAHDRADGVRASTSIHQPWPETTALVLWDDSEGIEKSREANAMAAEMGGMGE